MTVLTDKELHLSAGVFKDSQTPDMLELATKQL